MANLKVSFINVNGFRNQYKQQIILSRLKQLQFDIVFLQETHVINIIEANKFNKLWKGKAIWSFGSNISRGVGILFNPTMNMSIENTHYDYEGHIIYADIILAGVKLRLINVYAPNIPSERLTFLDNLQGYLITSREIILGGEWNCVENLKLDKIGGDLHRGSDDVDAFIKRKQDFYLKDVFRAKYLKKQFSFRKGPIHVR